MWQSLREYLPAVFRRWWLSVTVIVAGALWLASLFFTVPAIPPWVWVALFVLLLAAAQFLAFHDLRKHRDEGQKPGLSVLAQAPRWHIGGHAYTTEAHDTLLGTPEAFVGDPDVRLTFVTDLEMEAHGGATGGVLYGLTWMIRHLPDAATFEAPDVPMPIALPAGQRIPLKARLSIQLDKVRLSHLGKVWEALQDDPALVGRYHVEGNPTALETTLRLPRSVVVGAIAPWRKMVGLPPEA